jgi:hypothetical protein
MRAPVRFDSRVGNPAFWKISADLGLHVGFRAFIELQVFNPLDGRMCEVWENGSRHVI